MIRTLVLTLGFSGAFSFLTTYVAWSFGYAPVSTQARKAFNGTHTRSEAEGSSHVDIS